MERDRLEERLRRLEKEKEDLQSELRSLKRKPGMGIGFLLLLLGLILIALAFVYSHQVSAFIGIALTFWGGLLFYIRPTRFIRRELLDSTVGESFRNIHKLLDEMDFNGTPVYISPGTLLGLRSAVIYIPSSDQAPMPSDEQLSREGAFMNKPEAVKLTPPGLGLSRLLEEELKVNFSAVDLEYIKNNLGRSLSKELELADAFDMSIMEPTVWVDITGNIFDELVEELHELESHQQIGDPLSSAIACILARSTRRPVIIKGVKKEPEHRSTRIIYELMDTRASAK